MSIYQHFREDEKPFIDRVLDWKARVLETYVPVRTDFLNPREREIMRAVIGSDEELQLRFSGGFEGAERMRATLSPPYVEEPDFGLAFFELHYPKKFVAIDHRSLLGALIGLGIKREKLGDLLISEDRVQWVAAEEVAGYLMAALTRVGRHRVTCVAIGADELIRPTAVWEERTGTVSSLRLDAVLAEIYRLSRAKAASAVEAGLVKVNWKLVEKPAFELEAGDQLSVRGHGRSKLVAVEGRSKRGNHVIRYALLK